MSDSPESGPLKNLTFVGRLLLIVSMMLLGPGFYFVFMFISENLPPGRYPVFLIFIPIALFSGAFFFGMSRLLEKLGVKVFVKKDVSPPK